MWTGTTSFHCKQENILPAIQDKQGCYRDVTGLFKAFYWVVTGMLQGSYNVDTGMLQGCYKVVTGMLQGSSRLHHSVSIWAVLWTHRTSRSGVCRLELSRGCRVSNRVTKKPSYTATIWNEHLQAIWKMDSKTQTQPKSLLFVLFWLYIGIAQIM